MYVVFYGLWHLHEAILRQNSPERTVGEHVDYHDQ